MTHALRHVHQLLMMDKISQIDLMPKHVPTHRYLQLLQSVLKLHTQMQVLVMGKISQAAIVAGAAYRNEETFKEQTGIAKARLIKDKTHHDTKVLSRPLLICTMLNHTCAIKPCTIAAVSVAVAEMHRGGRISSMPALK